MWFEPLTSRENPSQSVSQAVSQLLPPPYSHHLRYHQDPRRASFRTLFSSSSPHIQTPPPCKPFFFFFIQHRCRCRGCGIPPSPAPSRGAEMAWQLGLCDAGAGMVQPQPQAPPRTRHQADSRPAGLEGSRAVERCCTARRSGYPRCYDIILGGTGRGPRSLRIEARRWHLVPAGSMHHRGWAGRWHAGTRSGRWGYRAETGCKTQDTRHHLCSILGGWDGVEDTLQTTTGSVEG